jgi:hypothetical protein
MTQIANQSSRINGNHLGRGGGALRGVGADLAFWFDPSRWVCMSGAILGIIGRDAQVLSEMVEPCPEQFDLESSRPAVAGAQ